MKEVAVGILRKGFKVLICQRRATAAYPLKWEFPGGKIEQGETPAEALRRELDEELGIDVTVEREFQRQEWEYRDSSSSNRDGKFRVFYFLVEKYSGEPTNRAFEQIMWAQPVDLPMMDILEGNRKVIDLLVDHDRERGTP
jgi:8-oxo-dGTP diphosphatase